MSLALAQMVQSPCTFEKIPKYTNSHLQELPPISFILPQLCAHGALKVIKQHVTEFVLSLTLHHIIPLLHPLLVPTGRFWGPWPLLSAASTAAPAARSCSTTAVSPLFAALRSGVQPQAPKGSDTSTAGGLHPVALHRPPPLQWEKLQSVE